MLQENSITQKQTSQNQIHTRIGNTNKLTHTKTSLHKQMLEQKCPSCTNIPRYQFLRTTLGTTHTTKCNYTCRSSGIVYLVTCKRWHKQYLGQTLGSLHTRQNESRWETQHLTRINIPLQEQPTHNQRHTNWSHRPHRHTYKQTRELPKETYRQRKHTVPTHYSP